MPDNLIDEINAINWRHKINLGNGIITPGTIQMQPKLDGLRLPENFEGKSVLDVGAWDGFYSFEAEKRNAGRILAIDEPVWAKPNGKAGFDLATQILNSHVESKIMSVYDLSPDTEGVFDVTLFLGVLYHLKYPLWALGKIASVTKELLILESYFVDFGIDIPLMTFHARKYDDAHNFSPSNYVAPNILIIKEMLTEVGFSKINDFGGAYQSQRVTIHARKN